MPATIHIVLDKSLLTAANRFAKKARMNRSAVIREALREYIIRKRYKELVEQEHRSYLEHPDSVDEILLWEREAAWPRR